MALLSGLVKRLLKTALANGAAATEIVNAVDAATNQATNATSTNASHTNLTTTNATIGSLLTMANNANVALNTTNGTMFGTAANQKMSSWGATPIVQPSGTGLLIGFTGNAADNVNAVNYAANGNLGTKSYSLGDVVRALKLKGELASS